MRYLMVVLVVAALIMFVSATAQGCGGSRNWGYNYPSYGYSFGWGGYYPYGSYYGYYSRPSSRGYYSRPSYPYYRGYGSGFGYYRGYGGYRGGYGWGFGGWDCY